MELEGQLTLTTVDKMVTFTRADNGDVIIGIYGREGTHIANRTVPKSQWDFIRKVLK